MRVVAVALVIVAIVLAGCAGTPSSPRLDAVGSGTKAPAKDVAAVEGIVSDDNFIPVQGAVLRLVEMGLEAKTAWNGKFAFPQVPADTYTLTVKAVGWKDFEETLLIKAGRSYTITIFLEPSVGKVVEPEVKLIRGVLNCAYVEAGGQNTGPACSNVRAQSGFPKDWAAIVTEATWTDGASTATQAILSLQYTDASATTGVRTYGRVASDSPARIDLLPSGYHAHYGADTATPTKGSPGPLDIDFRKASTSLSGIGASVTVQQSYEIYHSTFYFEAPDDLASYSARPDA